MGKINPALKVLNLIWRHPWTIFSSSSPDISSVKKERYKMGKINPALKILNLTAMLIMSKYE